MEHSKKVYPNYLAEAHCKSQTRMLNNSYEREVVRLKAIVGSNRINQTEKMTEVKSAVEKMAFTYQPNKELTDDEQLSRLRAKIKLLEILHER